MSTPRIGIAGIGLTSPLGESLQDAWQRLLAGQGAVGRMSFDGLPDIAAAQVTADNDRHLVADRLSAFLQGLDAAPSDSIPFTDDLSSTFDVVEAATAT